MALEYHFYEPSKGHQLKHDPFNALVAPRPIGWVSSQSKADEINLAPYSFFNAFNYTPPIIGFASVGHKDSLKNIEETGEFCWNLVTKAFAEKMNLTSASVEHDVDEFKIAGLETTACNCISVPRVAGIAVAMECQLTQILRLTTKEGHAVDTWMVFGEVVGVHINQAFIKNGIYDTASAEPILRGGGPADYFQINADMRFEMHRPKL
ncbi:flavin reductase family protein [Aliikangiella marina]|uniref:Flavin reductase family protein n=1 Tax=Aliikangiella marina TaxID=1712262 RepID=A0A545TJ47_9GAMM|nr:flavin reductase family protein [Aliikangiella marina]TQV77262.1 flavin reductase family protein [Aliikangiella marina]